MMAVAMEFEGKSRVWKETRKNHQWNLTPN